MGKHKKQSNNSKIIDLDNLNYLYGIPHCHTELSTGKGYPLEALEYGHNKGLNFMIITDHNSYLSEPISSKKDSLTKWKFLKHIIEKYNKKHEDFIALIGFESNSNPWGHINILNSNSFFKGSIRNFSDLILWLLADKNSFISINHPHSAVELIPYSKLLNQYIRAIEVGNGAPPHKYNRYDKRYFSMLDKGWMLGAINSQDNHRINFGDSENLTVVVTNKFDKPSLINGIKDRHTYSTESRTLKFYFTINKFFMGDEMSLPQNGELNFYIYAEDPSCNIEKIQIISNGGRIIKETEEFFLSRIKYFVTLPYVKNQSYYVVRIIQQKGKQALSSPIFIKIKNS